MLDPAVLQAALIGVADAGLGSRPAAFVTTREGTGLEAERLRGMAAERCGRDLSLMSITVVDELPMTPTGKIAKAQLAELAARGAADD